MLCPSYPWGQHQMPAQAAGKQAAAACEGVSVLQFAPLGPPCYVPSRKPAQAAAKQEQQQPHGRLCVCCSLRLGASIRSQRRSPLSTGSWLRVWQQAAAHVLYVLHVYAQHQMPAQAAVKHRQLV
jgi:hypothetical protein